MFSKSISWLICIFVAVATDTDYDEPNSIAGPVPEVKVIHLRKVNLESSTVEPVQEAKETAATDLGALLDAGKGAVVTLVAGDTRLVAHRAVLAARSPALAAMLDSDSSGQVTVTGVQGPVLRQLLAYLYSLQAPQLPGMALQLLAAADRYDLPVLKAECEQQVAAQLSVETAASTAVLAVRNSYTTLREAAVAFIKRHIFQVMATKGWTDAIRSNHEDLIKVMRLLFDSTAATSTPAAPTTQPHSDSSQTPDAAAYSLALCPTAKLDDTAISLLRNLSAAEKGSRLIKAANDGAARDLQMLLAAGADVGARDEKRNTALHWAAWEGQVEAAGCLVAAGAEVDAGNWVNNTPLHWAAWGGREDVVMLLTASSADPNARNEDGDTPLHFAAEHGRTGAAMALLDAGADKQAKNYKGNTPLDRATQFNHEYWIYVVYDN